MMDKRVRREIERMKREFIKKLVRKIKRRCREVEWIVPMGMGINLN